MKTFFGIVTFLLMNAFVISCQNSSTQTYTSGSTKILVDETFAPIIDDEIYVFQNTYIQAKIDPVYVPENQLLNSFLNDSIRVAVMSRELRPEEEKNFLAQNIKIRSTKFATDGIAIITHQSSTDSVIDLAAILGLLQGKKNKLKSLVFDNPNSSTVRYLRDLAGIKLLPKEGVYALKSNSEVITYVHNNPGTIGVIGLNWLEQPDEDMEQYVAKLRVLGVKNLKGKPGSDKYYKPHQTNLALGVYPLMRNLYIINCQGGSGLGSGLASFLAGEQGQRIILKSGLLPDSIPPREILIRK